MQITNPVEALRTSNAFLALTGYTRKFDPFKVMGVSTKELLHSRILAAFFDAGEPHGLGSIFRDSYLAALTGCRQVGAASPIAVDVLQNAAGARARVVRELANIDVLLDFPERRLVIAIENKIHALDQPEQVARYQKALCELFPHYQHRAIVYLTPSGRDSPTADLECPHVPVYYQSYLMVGDLLKQCSARACPPARQFIDQFVSHIERTMTDSSEIKDLCWNVFEQNEDAYERMAQHLFYCRSRKYATRFAALRLGIIEGIQFSEWAGNIQTRSFETSKGDNPHISLDVRLEGWPEGVWVKVYKHNWLGVFPYFLAKDIEQVSKCLPQFCTPAREVPAWPGYCFASARFQGKTERAVNEDGNRATDADYNAVLTRVRECIVELNAALDPALSGSGESVFDQSRRTRATCSKSVIPTDEPSGCS